MSYMNNSTNDIIARFQKLPAFDNFPLIFKGSRFTVRTLKVKGANGKTVEKDVVLHPGAVTLLPFVDEEHIVLIRNQRFVVGQELWELPAGTLEPGEDPLETAKRELIEETGYKAAHIVPLVTFFTTPGFCNEVMYSYVASQLTHVGQSLDDSEQIIVETVKWKDALKMVRDGTIVDGKTIMVLLYYHTFLNAGKSP